ncbi:MAG: FG-GAP repeat domain-containing protein, partial [Planctomycetota bacterium]|jgi:hypothetical protein
VLFLPVGGTQARGDGGFYDKTAEVPGFEVGTRTVDDIITGAASDLDQDGIQDLVVSATGEPLRILRGGGRNGQADGSFVLFASSAWRSSAGVDQFEVADFDGDGELDILGVRVGPDNFDRGDRVELQLKRGASFQHSWANWTQPRTIWGVDDIWCRQTVGTPKPIGVDMDRDGHLDLVSARCGVVSVVMGPFHPLPGETAASDELSYLNRSDALVYDHVFRTISGERVTSSIVVRDFNEDGLPDIVSLDLGLGTNVQVAYGQRNLTDAADLAGPSDFAIADGAGATTELFDPIGPWEYVLELTSSTAWASDAAIEVWWEEFEPQVAVADPDPQLHATPPASYRRIRRFAVVAGSFRFTVPAGAGPYVDGSVKARLLIVNHTGQSLPVGSVSLKRGKRFDNPARDFSVIQDLAGGASFDPTVRQHHTEIHDFDGDGVADIAVLTPQQQGLIVLRGQRDQGRPNGLFKAFDRLDPGDLSTMPSALYSFPTRPFQVRVADCNSDGIADLVVVRESSDNRSFDSALDVLFGIADANGRATGAFRAPKSFPLRVNRVTGFVLGDFNSDGIVDAAVGTSSAEQPLLLEGTGRLIVDETPEPEDD